MESRKREGGKGKMFVNVNVNVNGAQKFRAHDRNIALWHGIANVNAL